MDSGLGFPAVIEVVVEIPARSRNKYEFDEQAGVVHGWAGVTETLNVLRADRERWLEERRSERDRPADEDRQPAFAEGHLG